MRLAHGAHGALQHREVLAPVRRADGEQERRREPEASQRLGVARGIRGHAEVRPDQRHTQAIAPDPEEAFGLARGERRDRRDTCGEACDLLVSALGTEVLEPSRPPWIGKRERRDVLDGHHDRRARTRARDDRVRSEEHTSELQSH